MKISPVAHPRKVSPCSVTTRPLNLWLSRGDAVVSCCASVARSTHLVVLSTMQFDIILLADSQGADSMSSSFEQQLRIYLVV